MSKEIRSTIYMKEDMYDKFRLACNYKFGDKQGKIKKGMMTAIEFFIEVVEEEQLLAKKNQEAKSLEPEMSGLIEEGVIPDSPFVVKPEPRYQDKPIDFTKNLDDSPTLSAQSSEEAKVEPDNELEVSPVPLDVTEENTDEKIEEEVEQDDEVEIEPMVSELQPPPDLANELKKDLDVITDPQEYVENVDEINELEQVKQAKKSYKAEPQFESEGQKIVQEAIQREAEASVALDHDPNLQTVIEKPQLDQVEKQPEEVVEKPNVTDLAKRLAEERRKRNSA